MHRGFLLRRGTHCLCEEGITQHGCQEGEPLLARGGGGVQGTRTPPPSSLAPGQPSHTQESAITASPAPKAHADGRILHPDMALASVQGLGMDTGTRK